MTVFLHNEMLTSIRVPFALYWVSRTQIAGLPRCPVSPQAGDFALVKFEKMGENAAIAMGNGRRCALHQEDLVATVFGNRYAALQFDCYTKSNGSPYDLLSMGGLDGLVEIKHAETANPRVTYQPMALTDR